MFAQKREYHLYLHNQMQEKRDVTPRADLLTCMLNRGLFAIKDYRDAVNQDDFNKAVRKVAESKKLEGKLEYNKL